eukprot:1161301-Pelagomonas_calceolata.AAC.7
MMSNVREMPHLMCAQVPTSRSNLGQASHDSGELTSRAYFWPHCSLLHCCEDRCAEQLGKAAAEAGWMVLTGGRSRGVMHAACTGAKVSLRFLEDVTLAHKLPPHLDAELGFCVQCNTEAQSHLVYTVS